MLMHEWRKYRDRQISKVLKEAREAEPEGAADETTAGENLAPAAVAQPTERNGATLKSGAPRPKQILERLTAGNDEVREKLEALDLRQQVLPLDIEAAAAPPKRTGRVTESREELVQRLMDPVLSLEEAAILLDVCPTTVRRYTNRGVLKCYRTPGNQRRFRLSEIMSFMERRQRGS
ncbi:helix-turn-helix domain-containing protein [bacterium]|nr:helix-turn-helix domain-containing protein [bacterium]